MKVVLECPNCKSENIQRYTPPLRLLDGSPLHCFGCNNCGIQFTLFDKAYKYILECEKIRRNRP